ncbi:MAG: DUF2232 domain-containing protein [Eubacterium sp.]|nr:DUF2232 domain-containing protein [Candidatus Colimonas fimequi]
MLTRSKLMQTIIIAILILIVPYLVLPREIDKGDNSPYFSVLKSVIATLAAVLVFFAMVRMTGQGVYEIYRESVEQVVKVIAENGNLRGLFGVQDASQAVAEKQIMIYYDHILKQVPGYIVLMSTLVSYVDYIILSKSQSKRKSVQLMPKFKEFSFPPQTVTAMVLMYLIAFITNKMEMFPNDMIYVNINYVFDLVFVIQGVSVIFMWCSLRRWPRFVAVIIALLLWNFFMLRQILVLLGMIDMIFGVKGFLVFKDQMKSQSGGNRRNRRNRRK